MKKIFSILLAVMASVFFCNVALAKNIDSLKPLTTMAQLPAGATSAVCDAYPTCITVTNYSSYTITISVPALSFTRGLNPGYMQPIQSYDYNSKQVILYDYTGRPFYNAILPNHYDLAVYDRAGKLVAQAK